MELLSGILTAYRSRMASDTAVLLRIVVMAEWTPMRLTVAAIIGFNGRSKRTKMNHVCMYICEADHAARVSCVIAD